MKLKLKITLLLLLNLFIFGCGNSLSNENVTYHEQKLNSPTKSTEALKYYSKGYEEFHNENYEKAIINYKKAIEIDSNYTDAMDNCALSYRRLNKLDDAEFYYKLSLKKLPTNELAMHNLGLVYIFKNDFITAKKIIKK